MDRPQRLVFGTVAEAYDAHRPGYAGELFDDLVAMVGPAARALDAGAGTGKVAATLASQASGHKGIAPSTDPAPDGFAHAEVRTYHHTIRYSTDRWIGYLGTHSNHVMLEEGRRRELHAAVAAVIDDHGGELQVAYRVETWIARRLG